MLVCMCHLLKNVLTHIHFYNFKLATSERLSNPIIIVDMICSRLKEFRIANVVSVNNEEDKRDRILNELERSNEALIWGVLFF